MLNGLIVAELKVEELVSVATPQRTPVPPVQGVAALHIQRASNVPPAWGWR